MTNALLLDLGGTAFRSPLELMGPFADHEPAARGVLARRGPLGSERDELWAQVLRREISEFEYLHRRAVEVIAALGRDWGLADFMRALYTMPGEPPLRPEAASLVADARGAGIPVGALTNDMTALGGSAARSRIPFLAELDVLVDGSVNGVLKPDPRAYEIAAAELGCPASQTVYLDDLPWNVAGAEAAGMLAFHVDLTAPGVAFEAARDALALSGKPMPHRPSAESMTGEHTGSDAR